MRPLRSLLAIGLLFFASVTLAAERAQPPVSELSGDEWQLLHQADGIALGNRANPRLQVVFDANCPHSAVRYMDIRKRHPDLSIRWVPVAYYKPDSSQRARAILAAADPATALETNFADYDFAAQRGAYRAGGSDRLPAGNETLARSWRQWRAAGTPMFIRRIDNGQVQRFRGLPGDTAALDAFIAGAPGLKSPAARPAIQKER